MATEVIKCWTCDVCGVQEDFGVNTNRSPTGWVGVAINNEAPDGSWDQSGWKRHHICGGCAENPTVSIRVINEKARV